jgi:hypothetical protein
VGDETIMTSENMAAAVSQVDDLLIVEEDDRRHLFYEQMKEFFFAKREIKPEEVDAQRQAECRTCLLQFPLYSRILGQIWD